MRVVCNATIYVDQETQFQKIDGFGVNINAKYWKSGHLKPVVDFLIDDLGATLFRVDGYGSSDWIDPDHSLGEKSLSAENLAEVVKKREFEDVLGLVRYLNSRCIQPYMALSGVVPAWMCTEDGKTINRLDLFAQMAVDYVCWLRKNGACFSLFGPLNETDYGPPEGPYASPEVYAQAMHAIIEELDRRKLDDIRLVVAEQGDYHLRYVQALLPDSTIRSRIGALGIHAYADFHVNEFVDYAANFAPDIPCWMTEFGDLDQSEAHEERIAWACMQRLMHLLEDGMRGAILWDAFDNYHDHDRAWTTYGALKQAGGAFYPKKRYYAMKHISRYVRPGFRRIAVSCDVPEIKLLAFCCTETGKLTVIGMNPMNYGIHMNLDLHYYGNQGEALRYLQFDVYRTWDEENCARVTSPAIQLTNNSASGLWFTALPHSIFTVTNEK